MLLYFSLSFTKNQQELSKCVSFGRAKAKKVLVSEAFAPDSLTRGSALAAAIGVGTSPPPPGPHYKLALCANDILPRRTPPSKLLDLPSNVVSFPRMIVVLRPAMLVLQMDM